MKFFKSNLLILILLLLLPGQFVSAVCTNGFNTIAGVAYPCPFSSQAGPASAETFAAAITKIINISLAVVAFIAVGFLIFGGYRYIASRGNEEETEEAKHIIEYAIWGLVIVILSFAIVAIISNALINANLG